MTLYLSASYFSIFSEYISILIFICLPVVVLSTVLAIWLHYRQKRRKALQETIADDSKGISFYLADKASHSITMSPLAPEDKIGLVRECRKQLRKSKAKFMALKSDFSNVLKNMAATGNSPENNSPMQSLNEKITAYERQITDLQKKLEVLETVVPVQDERYYLRQVLKEKDNEIEHLKAATDKPVGSMLQLPTHDITSDLEIQKKLEQLQQENMELTKKINEKEKELAKNKELLDYIHKELVKNKTREIAAQPLS